MSLLYLGAIAKIAGESRRAHACLMTPEVIRAGEGLAALCALERLIQGGHIVGMLLEQLAMHEGLEIEPDILLPEREICRRWRG